MKTEIFENYSAFLDRPDATINGVDKEFSEANPRWADERYNKACWNCSGCSDCSGCSGCSRCSDCSDCSGMSPQKIVVQEIPVIKNIHSTVLKAIQKKDNALEMRDWHTCETTHCRVGWVVTLAGEAGKELEEKTSTLFAAMRIYKESSPNIRVSPVRFFDSNEKARADIGRCAEEEKALIGKAVEP